MKGENYLLKGDLVKAQQEFGKFTAGTGSSRSGLALLYLAQGRLNEAIEQLKAEPMPHEWLGRLYLKTGRFEQALKEFDEMNKEARLVESQFNQIRVLHYKGLAYLGMKSMTEVSEVATELRQLTQRSLGRKRIRFYHHLMGMVEMENERYAEAADYFEKAVSQLRSPYDFMVEYHPLFIDSLALAYYKKGELTKAQEQYERIQALTYHRIRDADVYAKSSFRLGKIAEERKEISKAVEYYETFLDLWKDADKEIPECSEANDRLKALKGQ
jgi:tetratricopeptide (TPR) repeat protein